jgi:hypothetical protein
MNDHLEKLVQQFKLINAILENVIVTNDMINSHAARVLLKEIHEQISLVDWYASRLANKILFLRIDTNN